MSDPIDPVEIAAKTLVDSMCKLGAGANDVARAVITALEKAGWRLVRSEDAEAYKRIGQTGTYHESAQKYGYHKDAK